MNSNLFLAGARASRFTFHVSRITLHASRLAPLSLALLTCASLAVAQTNSPPASSTSDSGTGTNVTKLAPVTVVGKLDVAREQIVPSLGASEYTINSAQIESQAQGENAPFNQVLLRAPGVVQDSLSQIHVRGEHANLQYRINDVLLPEGITGFGQELDTRFVNTVSLVTGSLPAQYGFRTAGIVDIHTKNGAFAPGGEASVYGGSYDTIRPSIEYGGSSGSLNYFVNGSYDHNGIGIENPTSSWRPIHDDTDQYKAFAYLSYVLDDTSRLNLIGSASYADFQLPNTPDLEAGNLPTPDNPGAIPWYTFMQTTNFDSKALNERQNEQNYYGVLAYQKSVGDLNFQLSGYGRYSSVHFKPDPIGDLFFDGVASDVDRGITSAGAQGDFSYVINDQHTLRGGFMVLDESLSANTITGVFPTDAGGNPTGPSTNIVDNSTAHALFFGIYLQDEWKIVPKLTLNYGARFDFYDSSTIHENQPSPRVNLIYEATDATTLHAGYARYFTPPPLENVASSTVQKFDNTSNASATDQGDPVKSERANYFDLGINQKLAPGLQVGVDGYYKNSVEQLDDGFFGATLIPSAFNYSEGKIYGVEFTTSYTTGGFATYANVAYSVAKGQNWSSAQFLFDPADLAYVKDHYIYLDHDQAVTGSFGASYLWKEAFGATRVYVDALYGSGLRTDGAVTLPDGTMMTIPNGDSLPSYYSVNCGAEQSIKVRAKQFLKARVDVVNITDNIYQLRNGAGVGVNAAQYGTRLGIFGSLSYVF